MITFTRLVTTIYFFLLMLNHNRYFILCYYIGCYNENKTDPVMLNPDIYYGYYSHTNMTTHWCTDTCRQSGYTFSGIQLNKCFCNDVFDTNNKPEEKLCNQQCAGNTLETCGGDAVISVFAVCPPGFYGNRDPICSLSCPRYCHSSVSKVRKSCHIITGNCVDQCVKGWSGEKCLIFDECDSVTGDKLIDNYTTNTQQQKQGNFTKMQPITDKKVQLFPNIAFTKKGMVSKIKYYAQFNGTVFISIWNILNQKGTSPPTFTAEYCGKIKLEVISGLHTYYVSEKERVVTDVNYCIGLHYPEGTELAAVPLTSHRDTETVQQQYPQVLSAIYGNTWWKVGSSQLFTIDDDSTGVSSIEIAVKVYTQCNTSCQGNMYGEFCDKYCGHCDDDVPCHLITGACPNKCKDGWKGKLCNEEVDSIHSTVKSQTVLSSSTSNPNHLINNTRFKVTNNSDVTTTGLPRKPVDGSVNVTIGLAVGVVVTLILLVIAIIGFTRCEIKKRNNSTHDHRWTGNHPRKHSKRSQKHENISSRSKHYI